MTDKNSPQPRPVAGQDEREDVMDLVQSFIDSVFKNNPDTCKMCLGDGRLSRGGKLSNPPIQCPQCKGAGKELIGTWVEYAGHNTTEKGRIKSFNDKWIFVVFHCDDKWDDFRNYTAAACAPESITFIEAPEVKP